MPQRKTKKPLTLGNLITKILNLHTNQILYTLLLVAMFLIGYLVARVQLLEKGSSQIAATPPQTAQAGQPAAPNPKEIAKTLTAGHFPIKGNANAKVTIVEFADFRCPFCERFFTDTKPQIFKDYVDTGKVKFIFRNYQFLGDASVVAGNAAECANEQDKFWEFHDWLYKNQPPESDTSIYNVDGMTNAATTLGLNTDQFRNCLSTKKYNDNVTRDMQEGQKIGTSGTPTFYINGRQLVGAQPYSAFKVIIDEELKK